MSEFSIKRGPAIPVIDYVLTREECEGAAMSIGWRPDTPTFMEVLDENDELKARAEKAEAELADLKAKAVPKDDGLVELGKLNRGEWCDLNADLTRFEAHIPLIVMVTDARCNPGSVPYVTSDGITGYSVGNKRVRRVEGPK